MSQNDTYYLHIGSTLCLKNNLMLYNAGEYASGTDIVMNLRLFVFDCLHLWFLKLQAVNKIRQRSMDLSNAS